MALEDGVLSGIPVTAGECKALALRSVGGATGTEQDAVDLETGDICVWFGRFQEPGDGKNRNKQQKLKGKTFLREVKIVKGKIFKIFRANADFVRYMDTVTDIDVEQKETFVFVMNSSHINCHREQQVTAGLCL